VSYHVLIDRNGTVYAVVNPDRKAWHAGVSTFRGEKDCNRYTVGVSLANRNDGEPYPPAQLESAAKVCAKVCDHYGIPVDRITTHAVIAPTRKTDPKGLDVAALQAAVGRDLLPKAA
jgi:N-acetyl-anhydromuramyl-L-alanine amidase AmpD